MKKFAVIVTGLFLSLSALAQENNQATESADGPVMTFDTVRYAFGDIIQGEKVEYTFNFKNTGNEPLIITNVQVTCGCTASDWPRDPIAPGQESSMTISFNSAGKMGRQNKVITIISNATNPNNRLSITANVLPKKN